MRGAIRCCAALVVLLLLSSSNAYGSRDEGGEAQCAASGPRADCGYIGIDEEKCVSRDCCWLPVEPSTSRPYIDLPWCFHRNTGKSSYNLVDTKPTATGGLLVALAQAEATQPELGPDVSDLLLDFQPLPGSAGLRMTYRDATARRWEVPGALLGLHTEGAVAAENSTRLELSFSYTATPFKMVAWRSEAERRAGGRPLVAMEDRFIFKDQYLEVSQPLNASDRVYGLGERTPSAGLELLRDGLPYTLWARDIGAENPDQNLYGSHPMLLIVHADGSAEGALLLNSNGMDVVLTPTSYQWRSVGGILDLYFFAGPTPADVMRQYTNVVGRPAMQPYWSLGFHQCKWGYKNVDELAAVVANYSAAGIPLDTIWSDIDYMHGWRDFTLDPKNFSLPDMRAFLDKLHDGGQQWVPIIDPGILIDPGYPAYDEGMKEDVWIKDAAGQPYTGQVWPGPVHYPDFLNPRSRDWWRRQLAALHDMVPFDGVWIDMNEASNFCSGEVCRLPDEHRVPAAPSDREPVAAPSAAQPAGGVSIVGKDSELSARLASSLAAAVQPLDGRTDSTAPVGTTEGTANGGRTQVQRQLLSVAAQQGVAYALARKANAAPGAVPRAEQQRSGSGGEGERKVDLSAYPRGSDVGKRRPAGGTDPTVCSLRCGSVTDAASSKYDRPPYAISNGNSELGLGMHTIGMTARHADGTLEYDAHNLYGLSEAAATAPAVADVTGKRPFILSRSTFPGSGQYVAHWTGDNAATWDDLRWSVTGVLNSGFFGIPMAGADICGFNKYTNEELCSRWISAGAFYPFSRSHSSIDAGDQELYRWESVAEAGRKALGLRYQLLFYLYTGLEEAHRTGSPLARPLWWHWPGDARAHNAGRQWMLGEAVLVSPVMEQEADEVEAYFPPGVWYSLWGDASVDAGDKGVTRTLTAPLGDVPVHARGGKILPMQRPALLTRDVRNSPLRLMVHLTRQAEKKSRVAGFLRRLWQLAGPLARPLRALERGGLWGSSDPACADEQPLVATGRVFMDDGDSVQISQLPGNYLHVRAEVLACGGVSHGTVVAVFGVDSAPHEAPTTLPGLAAPSGSAGAGQKHPAQHAAHDRCGATSWPVLDEVVVRGVTGAVDVDTVTRRMLPGGNDVVDADGRPLQPDQVEFDPSAGRLTLRNLAHQLRCPDGFAVTW